MATIPEKFHHLLSDDNPQICLLGVSMQDGSPHVTPVWFKWDGEFIIVNSAQGRLKDRAMRARPKVSVTIVDKDNMYNWVQVQGTVVEVTEEGGYDMICELALKYRGKREYPKIPGEVRVNYKIRPDIVTPRS